MPSTRFLAPLLASALTLACAVPPDLSQGDDLSRQDLERRQASVALGAKLLCSGVFVAGREPDEFIERDLQAPEYTFHDWSETRVDVDREARRVTVEAPGTDARRAVYTGDQGCVLLPLLADDVFFPPETIERQGAGSGGWPEPASPPLAAEQQERLDEVLAGALEEREGQPVQDTRALVVLRGDRLVAEAYAPGFDGSSRQIAWSMGKSVMAALVGTLVQADRLDVDAPAPVPAWQGDARSEITVTDLLQMSGGLDFNQFGTDDPEYYTGEHHHELVYFGAVDVHDYVLDRPLAHEPGTHWAYRNTNPLALGAILQRLLEAEGASPLAYPQRALFDKIGARDFVLETDPYGHFLITGFVYGTAYDWARFGLLHLQDGVWQGERVLPEGWSRFVSTPAPAHPQQGYGAQFWLNAGGRYASWPKDAYWAAGWLSQMVLVVPSRDVVFVRLGHSAEGGFAEYIEPLVADVLEILAESTTG
ncbi:MAG: serine hydrolase [Acidobacteriota bacterium]